MYLGSIRCVYAIDTAPNQLTSFKNNFAAAFYVYYAAFSIIGKGF